MQAIRNGFNESYALHTCSVLAIFDVTKQIVLVNPVVQLIRILIKLISDSLHRKLSEKS